MSDVKATSAKKVSVRPVSSVMRAMAQQQMQAAQQQTKMNDGPVQGAPQDAFTDPSLNASNAVVTLGEMVGVLSREVGGLEAIMRAHMPNNLYDQKSEVGSIVSVDSGYFGNVVLSSPVHSDLVKQLNEMWHVVEHLRYLQKHVVV